MNLDELQSVQARERQSSDLQHLRSSFYREVGEYIDELTDRRAALVEEADDPFSSPDVRQLSDDIETAEQTVEAIYERRVGKVVKKASIAAAGMPVDDDGLTEEEEALFEALVDRIERNRETVLSVLDGEPPAVADAGGSGADGSPGSPSDAGSREADAVDVPDPVGDAEAEGDDGVGPDGVDAADLMGGGDDEPTPETATGTRQPGEPADGDPEASRTSVPPDDTPPERRDADSVPGTQDPTVSGETAEATSEEGSASDPRREPSDEDGTAPSTGPSTEPSPGDGGSSESREIPGIPRTTVRITADVGEVVGADDRDYDLGPEDVVTLPEANADVLVEKDAAERLE